MLKVKNLLRIASLFLLFFFTYVVLANAPELLLSRNNISLTTTTTQSVLLTNNSNITVQVSIPANLYWSCSDYVLKPRESCIITAEYDAQNPCETSIYPITSNINSQKNSVELSVNNVCSEQPPYIVPVNNVLSYTGSFYLDVIAANGAKAKITNANFTQTEGSGLSLINQGLPTECGDLENYANTCRIGVNIQDKAWGSGIITLDGNFDKGQYQFGIFLPKDILHTDIPMLILQPPNSIQIEINNQGFIPIDLPNISVTGALSGNIVIDDSKCSTIGTSPCFIRLSPLPSLEPGMQGNLVIAAPQIQNGSFFIPISTAGALSVLPVPKSANTSMAYQQISLENTSSTPISIQNITLPDMKNLMISSNAPYSTTCSNDIKLLPNETCTLWLVAKNNQDLGMQTGNVEIAYEMEEKTYQVNLSIKLETDLFAVGNFSMAGDQLANFVAAWDGSEWRSLAYGLTKSMQSNMADDGYSAMTAYYSQYDGNLYVGGEFGRNSLLAVWNGYAWSPALNSYLGNGGTAYSVTDDGMGTYYMTGNISTTMGNNVFQYNSVSGWKSVGDGIVSLSGIFTSLYQQRNLYVGGSFADAGGVPNTQNVAQWNGSAWIALGNGLEGSVNQLVLDGAILYAVGNFSLNTQMPSMNIATFNGVEWLPFQGGTNGLVNAIVIDGNKLYIGGVFSQAGQVVTNGVALWDGQQWNALAHGIDPNGEVKALVIDGSGNLYVAGHFQTADGNPAKNIAMWDGSSWKTLSNGINGTIYGLTIAPTLTAGL